MVQVQGIPVPHGPSALLFSISIQVLKSRRNWNTDVHVTQKSGYLFFTIFTHRLAKSVRATMSINKVYYVCCSLGTDSVYKCIGKIAVSSRIFAFRKGASFHPVLRKHGICGEESQDNG